MRKKLGQTIPLVLATVLMVALADPNGFVLAVGGFVVFLGEAVRVWASGHLNRNNEITTSGPYSYVRDPLYLGRLFLLVGFCVMGWGYNWIILIVGLAVFFVRYMPRKHRKETARLENLFGSEYIRYASYARSLVPRFRPYPHARRRRWSFDLFWNGNREQYLLSGVIVLSLLLILRSVYR